MTRSHHAISIALVLLQSSRPTTIVFRRRRTFFHILEMQDPFYYFCSLKEPLHAILLFLTRVVAIWAQNTIFFLFFFLFRKAKKVRRRRVSTRLEFALMRIPLFTGQHVFEGPKQEEGQLISGDFHFRGKHTQLSILPFFHYFYKIDLWPSLLKEDHHFMQIEFLGLPQKYIGNWIVKMVGAATV